MYGGGEGDGGERWGETWWGGLEEESGGGGLEGGGGWRGAHTVNLLAQAWAASLPVQHHSPAATASRINHCLVDPAVHKDAHL